jgi:hypothetical protein
MFISKIEKRKSQTIGWRDADGKPHYKKIELFAEGTMNESDDKIESRDKVDDFIEGWFTKEKAKK